MGSRYIISGGQLKTIMNNCVPEIKAFLDMIRNEQCIGESDGTLNYDMKRLYGKLIGGENDKRSI